MDNTIKGITQKKHTNSQYFSIKTLSGEYSLVEAFPESVTFYFQHTYIYIIRYIKKKKNNALKSGIKHFTPARGTDKGLSAKAHIQSFRS